MRRNAITGPGHPSGVCSLPGDSAPEAADQHAPHTRLRRTMRCGRQRSSRTDPAMIGTRRTSAPSPGRYRAANDDHRSGPPSSVRSRLDDSAREAGDQPPPHTSALRRTLRCGGQRSPRTGPAMISARRTPSALPGQRRAANGDHRSGPTSGVRAQPDDPAHEVGDQPPPHTSAPPSALRYGGQRSPRTNPAMIGARRTPAPSPGRRRAVDDDHRLRAGPHIRTARAAGRTTQLRVEAVEGDQHESARPQSAGGGQRRRARRSWGGPLRGAAERRLGRSLSASQRE